MPEDRSTENGGATAGAADNERVFRFDLASGSVGARRRTPQGGLVVDANLTRTGVFTYRTPDGGTRRELRHPDDVMHPDSLASYAMAPVTADHPGRVHPGNWKTHAIGHVAPGVRPNGHFVAGEVHLQDADAIERAERSPDDPSALREVSCGYICDFEPIPGEYMGQKHDGRQFNLRMNHIALGPKGWGRMGPETRLHLDARECVSGEIDTAAGETEEREDAAPHVVVHHGADGVKVTPHPSKSAAVAHGKELRAQGATAHVFSEKDYKKTQDPSYKLTRAGASEVAKSASEVAASAGTADAHIAAAKAHHEAAEAHGAVGAHATAATHEATARAHEASAASSPDFDEAKHHRGADGKFDAASPHYVRADSHRPVEQETMTDEEKKALERAKADAEQAGKDLDKARQDAASAKSETDKLEAQARADKAEIIQLRAERDLLKLQQEKAKQETQSTASTLKQDAEAEARVEERNALRADARIVFASKEDPEGKKWKADGKSADDIRREIVAELYPTLKFDGVEGVGLAALCEQAMTTKRATDKARADAEEAASGRRQDEGAPPGSDDDEDDEPPPDANKARKAMVKNVKTAWKKNADRKPGKR